MLTKFFPSKTISSSALVNSPPNMYDLSASAILPKAKLASEIEVRHFRKKVPKSWNSSTRNLLCKLE